MTELPSPPPARPRVFAGFGGAILFGLGLVVSLVGTGLALAPLLGLPGGFLPAGLGLVVVGLLLAAGGMALLYRRIVAEHERENPGFSARAEAEVQARIAAANAETPAPTPAPTAAPTDDPGPAEAGR